MNNLIPAPTLTRAIKYGAALSTLILAACGGGGGDDINTVISSSSSSTSSSSSISSSSAGSNYVWETNVYPNMDDYWSFCESPRQGNAPYNGLPYPDQQGSYVDENVFLRSFSNEFYLWYNEITDQNPILFTTTDYFELMKTNQLTPTGAPKDKFHWYDSTESYRARSESGVAVDYGMTWSLLSSTPPREAVIVLTEPNSSAGEAGIGRGARITAIDGVDLVNDNTEAGVNTLNAALFPSTVNESHTFTIQDLGSSTTRDVVLTASEFSIAAVHTTELISTDTGNVGYMLFNSHIATAEAELIAAIEQFSAAGINDLILDLRYNGGGFLDIANELSYMIGGTNTAGKTFYSLEFNDKHPEFDPFSGDRLDPIPFHTLTQNFSVPAGSMLPALNLNRVFVLTGSGTCSASEAIINSLAGVDVEVIQIGTPTCGKPYGAYVIDNCGLSYFTIQFRGTNAKGFGDYSDGFYPGDGSSSDQSELPGCLIYDDYYHELGDIAEARLAAALYYRATGSCPADSLNALSKSTGTAKQKALAAGKTDGVIPHRPGMGDMILRQNP